MPRTKEQNEEIRRQRKQEILRAAIHVYVDKGYAASDMGAIADRAGLAHGLVFYYFKNKKNLFRELYEFMMEESRRNTTAHFEQDGATLDLFRGYARLVCERVLDNPAIPRFYARIGLDAHHLFEPGEISPFEWVKSFMHPMVEAIGKGVARGEIRPGDAGLMAMQFWGSVSQGMTYLEQARQDRIAQGMEETALKESMRDILDQVVESSIALFKA